MGHPKQNYKTMASKLARTAEGGCPHAVHSVIQFLVHWRLELSEDRGYSGTSPKFSQQSLGGVLVGLAGIRGIGPHRVVNDLRGFTKVHVRCGFEHVHPLLKVVKTFLADRRRYRRAQMILLPVAVHRRGRRLGRQWSGNHLCVEIPEEALALFFQLFWIR